MRAFTSIPLVALSLVVTACGSDDRGAGRIETVFTSQVWLDKAPAAGGDTLLEQSVLATDGSGSAQFRLHQKFRACTIRNDNEVRILPPPRLIEFMRGDTICSTHDGDRRSVDLRAGGAAIDVRDTVFAVRVAAAEVEVRVFRGFAEVRRQEAEPGRGRLLGPGGRTTIAPGEEPRRPTPVDPDRQDPTERQTVDQMVAAKPQPDFGRPAPDGSPTLQAIEQEETIDVAVDRRIDEPSKAFVASFLAFLGEKWGVEVNSRVVISSEAGPALASGAVDLVVTPEAVPAGRSLGFFEDDANRVVSVAVKAEDERFEASLQRFLEPALETGEYGRRYLAAFGQVPTYEAVRPLVFPSTEPVEPSLPPAIAAPGSSSVSTQSTRSSSPDPTSPGSSSTVSFASSTSPAASSSTSSQPPGVTTAPARCNGEAATIVGTPAPDKLQGSEGRDVIAGLGGDDEIRGRGGDDVICGNDGHDDIWGDDGADTILGDAGDDLAYGGSGDDRIFALEGQDRMNGGDGADLLDGGAGDDVMWGNAGADTMRGGAGGDVIVANAGHGEDGRVDVLEGGDGNDLLDAPDGRPNDVLNGGPGTDRCRADPGEQTSDCETFT